MLTNGNDVLYNSSEESDEILSPRFLPESSLVPSQSQSQSQDDMELGIDLGRRLARLELGNEVTKEQLDKIKQKNRASDEALVLENSKIGDLEGKVILMETRLLSEEKQGIDANEKIIKLEESLGKKNEEISALKKMLVKHKDNEERFAKLERDKCELTNQFVKLLDTCETFSDELESQKKINLELIKNLKKDTTLTSKDQSRKIKIDCDTSKNPLTSFCDQEVYPQGGYNPNYYYSASTGDEVPAIGPIYYPQSSEAAESFCYPEGAQTDMMYFSGATSQSDGWEMMRNPDSGVYY